MYKRNGIWYTTVRGPRESLRTSVKSQAKLVEDRWRNEAFERKNGIYVRTFAEAASYWLDHHKHVADYKTQERYEKWWSSHLGDVKIDKIDKDLVDNIIRSHRPIDEAKASKKNATANIYVAFLRKVIRYSKVQPESFRKYLAPRGKLEWLRPEEWATLEATMLANPAEFDDLRHICTFGLATGLREDNDMDFQWSWLHNGDTSAFLPPEVTKTDLPYGIPLNRTAQRIIKERRAAVVRHPTLVFTERGRPWKVWRLLNALERAVKLAGVPRITYHGFRHTFASWLAQKGVSDTVRKRLGCWKLDGGASSRYVHFDVESLRPFSEMLDTVLSQSGHLGQKVVENQ